MTIDQFLNMLIVPVGGLVLGLTVFLATRGDRKHNEKPHPGE
ncbi:hypothetical protein [Rhizobium sp. BE258]|jgi:hypothetical protein|nr:hypothetical protein [Rhizobium sp. BE258]MDR7146621.1 hypothetical protein [Rhizobium sp. BE258]